MQNSRESRLKPGTSFSVVHSAFDNELTSDNEIGFSSTDRRASAPHAPKGSSSAYDAVQDFPPAWILKKIDATAPPADAEREMHCAYTQGETRGPAETPAISQPAATATARKGEDRMPKAEKKTAKASGKKKVSSPAASKNAATPVSKAKTKKGAAPADEKAKVLSSKVVYEGSVFNVNRDRVIEPGCHESDRDIIRHNGSVVILAADNAKSKKNPWVVMERQYRHAANQYLWELPAGKIEAGEDPLEAGKRELAEETGYAAKKWKPLVEYFASPGFLGEAMKVYLAEGLIPGEAHPEEDEKIEIRLVKLHDILKMIDKGMIQDGKTLSGALLYARKVAGKRR
jgi:ADP-ribose pyrophosphatase